MTMNEETAIAARSVAVRGDVPRNRKCLRCTVEFPSAGFGERICPRCKGLSQWRSAAPVSAGTGRRR